MKIQTEIGKLKSLSDCSIEELKNIAQACEDTIKEKEMEIDMLIEDFIGAFKVLQDKGIQITVVNSYAEHANIYNADDFNFEWD